MKNLYKLSASCCTKLFFMVSLFMVTRVNAQESMRANLYAVNAGVMSLVDGNLIDYSKSYSNDIDIHDAWKMTNPGINFGILRSGYNLAIERRNIYRKTDTCFFRMWNVPQTDYSLKFILKGLDHPGMKGFLKDSYLNSISPVNLNDTTFYNFTVNSDPASAAEMRFQLIYAPDPKRVDNDVQFINVKPHRDGANIQVDWAVLNEGFVDYFAVEHSNDGIQFEDIQQIIPDNSDLNSNYNYPDNREKGKIQYYRIHAVDFAGKSFYSNKAVLNEAFNNPDFAVYPNPVINNKFNLSCYNLPEGKYSLTLISASGTSISLPPVYLKSTDSEKLVNIPGFIASGIYRLLLSGQSNIKITKTINIL